MIGAYLRADHRARITQQCTFLDSSRPRCRPDDGQVIRTV